MERDQKFTTALFGFNKKNVNLFISEALENFESEIQDKNNEITSLKAQIRDLRAISDRVNALESQVETLERISKSKDHTIDEEKSRNEVLTSELRSIEAKNESLSLDVEKLRGKLSEYESDISALNEKLSRQSELLIQKDYEIQSKLEQLSSERMKVSETLILAKETAESIIEDARTKANLEILRNQEFLESERMKFLEFKKALRVFKHVAHDTFSNIDGIIESLIEGQEYSLPDFNEVSDTNFVLISKPPK